MIIKMGIIIQIIRILIIQKLIIIILELIASNQTGKFKFKRDKKDSVDNNNNNKNINIINNKKGQEKEEVVNNINNENINKKEKNNLLDELNIEENNLLKSIYDEIEYLDIRKSIKFHENQTNDEIEYKLSKKNEKNNNINKKTDIFSLKNLIETENEKEGEEDDNNNLNKLLNTKLLNDKDFCVEKLEENIKYIKYFSRKNYEEIRDSNKRKVMFVMIGIMVFVFILYLIGTKYGASINKILKIILIATE